MGRNMALLLVLALTCTALQIQPSELVVDGGVGTSFEQVFTVINNEPTPISGIVQVDPFSQYLEESAVLTNNKILLKPQESMNLQVRGEVPPLGPEEHNLKYNILDGSGSTVGSFEIKIPIEGEAKAHPKISLLLVDVVVDEPVSAQATLYNFGNVNLYYDMKLTVKESGDEIGSIKYPFQEQVIPGDQKEITLLYTDFLEPGEYVVELSGVVNGDQQVSATQPFRVLLSEQRQKILHGEDLILKIKRYSNTPKIEYIVRQGSNELIRDTVFLDGEELIVPTSLLESGKYDVVVEITHGAGTDTNRISLEIVNRRMLSIPLLAFVLVIGVIVALFSKNTLLNLRISILEWRVGRREKLLRELIQRAHSLQNKL